jgi:hypothetical protein
MAAEGLRHCGKAGAVKRKLAAALLVVAALFVTTLSAVATTTRPALAASGIGPGTKWPVVGFAPNEATDNVILKWDERLLESIRLDPKGTGPTVAARALGILHSATYDAWAAFDGDPNDGDPNDGAVDSRRRLQQNPGLRHSELASTPNKEKAISYAAYQVLINLFPSRKASFDGYMTRSRTETDPGPGLGYGATFATESVSYDPNTPAGIGNLAAQAVLQFRATDNSNQTKDDKGTPDPADDTVTYPDPCTTPKCYDSENDNTWDKLNDPWLWQPLCVSTKVNLPPMPTTIPEDGVCPTDYAVQKPLTPQWPKVTPFGPLTADKHYPPQFTLPGPPTDGAEIDLELRDTSNLSETQKAKADYWADGPHSEFPPGHMAVFAQALSRMRKNTLDQDAKLFFVLGNALMDSSISAWASKYQYDSWRPISAIRYRYNGRKVNSWLGPGKGYGTVLGQNWLPYQEPTVVTPPFPEYVSGHSTFSAAGRTVLLQFYNNNDAFNASVVIPKGESKIEPKITPSKNITITWKTLSDASDDAGWSRRWGGIHFYSGDQQGRTLGRLIGYNDWNLAQKFFSGTVTDQDLVPPQPLTP